MMTKNLDIAKWVDTAKNDLAWQGEVKAVWEYRFLELYKELERANKIIDRLISE